MDKKYTAIKCGKIIMENKILSDMIIIFDKKIIDIIDEKDFEEKSRNFKMKIINAAGKYISPGFIDIHIHGSGGKDTMDGDLPDLEIICKTIAKSGVTGFLPTTMTLEKEKIFKALDTVEAAMKKNLKGAKVLGAHLEGPFINREFKGAQDEDYLMKPDIHFIEGYQDVIKIITLAPEEDLFFNFIKSIKQNTNITLSMGHTNSDYETALKAIEFGISSATHIFNAMPPLHHRYPGAVGAVLNSDISFELIADTIHVHPAFFQILLNAKGKDKMILITDSMRAGLMKNGIWDLGGQNVTVDHNLARLADGTLAGSVLTLNKAVYNIVQNTNLELYEAVALASINPARLIHMEKSKGSIEIGKDADLIIFDDDLKVELTISEGEIIFQI